MICLTLFILGLPLTVFVVRSVWSFYQRLRTSEPSQPPLLVRRWTVVVVTLIAVAVHYWSYWPLMPQVPAGAPAGTVIYRGPGDGLYYFTEIFFPWATMQVVNAGLACFCSRSLREAALVGSLLLATWIAVGRAGDRLLACPDGMVCAAG